MDMTRVDPERISIIIKKAARVAVVWVISTILAILLSHLGLRVENLLLIYLAGVVVSIVETSSLFWGIGAAFIFVFTFNFLFTAPKFTFMVDDPNYVLSLMIFVAVAVIVSTLTIKLQKQMEIANRRTEAAVRLNQTGSGFLTLSGYPAIARYSQESLEKLTGRKVDLLIRAKDGGEFEDGAAEWCYAHSAACGYGENQFSGRNKLYVPVKNSSKTYGVLIFDCEGGALTGEERLYVDTVISQITLVLEREKLSEEKEEGGLQIERERLKSTLLRSISHDLRTPLTGIAGSADFLYGNYDELDQQAAKSMLRDICTDAEWLNSMVENLLNMTRIQEGRLEIHKQKEVVDDLISGAVTLVSKRIGNHTLRTSTPADIVLFPVDGRLFTQVLVNLMDNAFRHSGEGTTVTVSACPHDGTLTFTVADDGVGIPEGQLEQIFDNFFTTAYQNGDKKRGVGLGLTICKAIVEAHGGQIRAGNSPDGGAVFQVDMPLESASS